MLYLIHADETLEELPTAKSAELEEDAFVCRDAGGAVVARYDKLDVLVFGHDERILGFAKRPEVPT